MPFVKDIIILNSWFAKDLNVSHGLHICIMATASITAAIFPDRISITLSICFSSSNIRTDLLVFLSVPSGPDSDQGIGPNGPNGYENISLGSTERLLAMIAIRPRNSLSAVIITSRPCDFTFLMRAKIIKSF